MKTYYKPKLYLSARISPDARERNDYVAELLSKHFDVFKPHEYQATTQNHEDVSISAYRIDLAAMTNSDLAVLLPPYGRDCATEVGYYIGAGKPIYIYTNHDESWLRDVMVKGGVCCVFTSDMKMYQRLLIDPILKSKCDYIEADRLSERILISFDALCGGRVIIDE